MPFTNLGLVTPPGHGQVPLLARLDCFVNSALFETDSITNGRSMDPTGCRQVLGSVLAALEVLEEQAVSGWPLRTSLLPQGATLRLEDPATLRHPSLRGSGSASWSRRIDG